MENILKPLKYFGQFLAIITVALGILLPISIPILIVVGFFIK